MSRDHTDRVCGEHWFIFGERADGRVDLSDGNDDVFVNIPRSVADRLLDLRIQYLAETRNIVDTLPPQCLPFVVRK